MREIKFRAWDIDHKTFTYFDFSDLESMELFWGNRGIVEYTDFTGRYQEYTGLKDKNGTEIYEGDIVLDNFLDNTWEVYYDNESAWFWLRNGNSEEGVMGYWNCSDDPAYPSWDRYEVIGNIYTNPELLKK